MRETLLSAPFARSFPRSIRSHTALLITLLIMLLMVPVYARREALARQAAQNKQIIVITDGEPTAHIEGRDLVLIYPPSEKTARATLNEVKRCANSGIRVSSFALIEDYFYLGLANFVEQMARASLDYSFLSPGDKAKAKAALEQQFAAFEAALPGP